MRLVKIYGLINPIDESVFYVGITKKPLEKRLYEHLMNKSYNIGVVNDRVLFIKKLKEFGCTPKIILLEEVPFEKSNYYEEYYYNLYIEKGYSLIQDPTKFKYFTTHTAVKKEKDCATATLLVKDGLYNRLRIYAEDNGFTIVEAIRYILNQFLKTQYDKASKLR